MRDDAGTEALRLPPHSLEAEQAVLGALLISADGFDRIADRVDAADFYSHAHLIVFDAIRKVVMAGRGADPITVAEALQDDGKLEQVGGLPYLGQLAQATPSTANVVHYADIVRDRSVRRRLATLAATIAESAYARDGRTSGMLLEDAQRGVLAITEATSGDDPVPISTLLPEVVDELERRRDGGGAAGMPTGLTDLDAKILGLHPGELVIVAGRPGMGKTTLGVQFGLHAAIAKHRPGLCFSLEMKGRALAARAIASIGSVNTYAMRSGRMDAEDWSRVSSGIAKIEAGAPFLIDGSPRLSVDRLRARAKRAHRRTPLSIIVVDYLQLMDGAGDAENRNTELAAITRGLKLLAMELDVPVVALSQLSRKCEERQNKRPMLSDLRDSGALEQDADVVLFVYQESHYLPNDDELKGKAEIIVAKHREGEVGTVHATFLGQFNRFADTTWRPTNTGARASGSWGSDG